jgi:hypothetical protein
MLASPSLLAAQDAGLRFESGSSWQDIQKEAKAANKYVLAYICRARSPECLMMDTSVFVQRRVGVAVNDKFVAVKVNADTSASPAADATYIDAPALRVYKGGPLPSYLFFSPAGTLVHRGNGMRDTDGFIKLAIEAQDPAKQYYTQLARYQNGAKDYSAMAYLARTARTLGDTAVARAVAKEYIDHLSANERYTRDNILFIGRFTERSNQPGFAMFVQRGDMIDSVVGGPGYAQSIVDRVITTEDIKPVVFPAGKPAASAPDWNAITATIAKKHGKDAAERNVLDAQIDWNKTAKNSPQVIRYTLAKIDKYGARLPDQELNGLSWDLFLLSSDKDVLEKGSNAMERIVKTVEQHPGAAGFMGPAFIDTYANLLYKAGKTSEAIAWEVKAVQLTPKDSFWWRAHTTNLAKMRNGEPTWREQ